MTSNSDSCTVDSDCGASGLCLDGRCECLPYWDGERCEDSFKESAGVVFLFWRIFFTVSFSLIFLFIVYRLGHYYHQNRENPKRFKTSSYILLLLSTLCRVLYVGLDPMKQTYLVPSVVTELLDGLSVYFLFTVFLFILLYWIGLYHTVFQPKRSNLVFIPKTKKIFFGISIFWLVLELSLRLLYGLEMKLFYIDGPYQKLQIFYTIYLFLLGVCFSFGYTVYGALIYLRIRKVQFEKKSKGKATTKLTFIITVLSWTFLIGAVIMVLLVRFKAMDSPYGSIFGLSLQYLVQIALYLEILYILKDDSDHHQHERKDIEKQKEPKQTECKDSSISTTDEGPDNSQTDLNKK